MITVEVRGLPEARAWLSGVGKAVRKGLPAGLNRMGVEGVEYAQSISPVVTGSYRAAHQSKVDGLVLTIGIAPGARNAVTGASVSRYAGSVERRHNVYGRLAVKLDAMGDQALDRLGREIERVH